VIRDERLETSLLAVDTRGYTDVGMAIAIAVKDRTIRPLRFR
jgi:hypothetical protein